MPEKTIIPAHPAKQAAWKTATPRAGRSKERGPKDLMHRLRSRVWFSAVANRFPKWSVNAMDVDLLGLEDATARIMWRIRRYASDPGAERSKILGGRSVVEVIGDRPGYYHTRKIYESELFTHVLAPRVMGQQEREVLISLVLERLKLYEPDLLDIKIAKDCNLKIKGFEDLQKTQFSRWLWFFSRKRSIDRILLLCLLYRRAWARANFMEAIALRGTLQFLIKRFCSRCGFEGDTEILWKFITWRRVLTGRLSLEHSDEALRRVDSLLPECWRSQSERKGRDAAWIRYLFACMAEMETDPESSHIIGRTAEVDAFLAEREFLREQVQRADLAKSEAEIKSTWKMGADAQTRFAEMAGYREPWRPGDY